MAFPLNPNAFAGYPLDKAGHRRRDAAWLSAALAREDAQLALFHKLQPFIAQARATSVAKEAVWLAGAARDKLTGPGAITLFLGEDERGAPHFAAALPDSADPRDLPIADLGGFEDMRAAAAQLSGGETALLGCAKALLEWHARHGFCAACGGATTITDGGWKRACAACGAEHFPKVDPVVIMLAVRAGRCCLGRQKRFPRGMYSALAGFVEPGESLEEACARELFEEVGLRAVAVRYHSTQPWPFAHSLMVGLIAEVDGDQVTLDQDEIDEAIWLTRDQAAQALSGGAEVEGKRVWAPPPLAIAHQFLKAWVEAG
jgi:NAD+ diphosphatase